MKHTSICISLLALCLAIGACEFFSDGPDASESRDGFLIEAGPILFVSDEGGLSRQLYSMQPDGSDIRQLTRSSSRYGISDAVWSPNGQRILIHEYGPIGERYYIIDGTPKVMKAVEPDGTEVSRCRLDKLVFVSDMVWSPDSERYVVGNRRRPRINHLVDSRTCDDTQIGEIPSAINAQYPSEGTFLSDWSSDGLILLGTTDNLGHENASDNTRNIPVTFWAANGDSVFSFGEVGAEHINPIWSHSEEQIAVGRYSDEGWFLYKFSSDGGTKVRLTDEEYSRVLPIAWSPDDSKILTQATYPKPVSVRLLIVDADGGGIVDITPFPGEVSLATSWRSN